MSRVVSNLSTYISKQFALIHGQGGYRDKAALEKAYGLAGGKTTKKTTRDMMLTAIDLYGSGGGKAELEALSSALKINLLSMKSLP